MRTWMVSLICLVGAVACTKTPDPASAVAPNEGVTLGSPRPAGNEGLVQGGNAFVTQLLLVKKQGSDAKEIDEPGKKKKVANWVATVYRGEQVTVLGTQGDWAHVRLSDGKEGYAKADAVLSGSVDLATVFDKVKTFTRPDLLAFNTQRQVEPGSLLFVLRTKDQFSEVNVGGSTSTWVLSDVLTKDGREVEAAKLLNRIRILKERNEAEAAGAVELAKTQFADTKLVQGLLLATDPNAAANPNGVAAPLPPGEPSIVPPPAVPPPSAAAQPN